MQPTENRETPNLNLPKPIVEAGGPLDTGPESRSTPEALPASPETANSVSTPSSGTPVPQTPIADIPLVDSPIPTPTPSAPASPMSTPAVADDNDLIEKEWVVKAKKIVETNREDPYNQSKDMNIFRADYMKKRYNKTLKLGE